MQTALTRKQRELLDYIEAAVRERGAAPSLREAAADLGVTHAAVAQMVKALEEKGHLRREGRYSRTIHLLRRAGRAAAVQRSREVPVVGRVQAGLPLYAQQEWDGAVVVDRESFRGENLFALRVKGDSMREAGIVDGDIVICEPRQFAANGEIVVALVRGEEATVKRFFLREDHVELAPENPAFAPLKLAFGEVLVQGRVVGLIREPAVMERQ